MQLLQREVADLRVQNLKLEVRMLDVLCDLSCESSRDKAEEDFAVPSKTPPASRSCAHVAMDGPESVPTSTSRQASARSAALRDLRRRLRDAENELQEMRSDKIAVDKRSRQVRKQ